MTNIARIRSDLVIIGEGFMGLALAMEATKRGLESVIVEPNQPRRYHYMSGLIASRADYLPLDMDEVELTAVQCRRWLETFPDIIKPKLFIMPLHDNSPYSYSFLNPLMELYDRLTFHRLGKFYQPHFRVSNMVLEQMEPNLRKSFFNEALGFYELTADPDELLSALRQKLFFSGGHSYITYPDEIRYFGDQNRLLAVQLFFGKDRSFLIESNDGLTFVNCAGPWMQEVASPLGISLPVEYNLGFQIRVQSRYIFQHPILTFGPDGKYTFIIQSKDHIQVGPTNLQSSGPDDLRNQALQENAAKYSFGILENTVEPGTKLAQPAIKSGGLRVKLKLPFAPDSHRPFALNVGFENYHVLYPGKAVLALRTADEFLSKTIEKKKFFVCLNGNRKTVSWFKLNFLKIKSLVKLGCWYAWYYIKKTLHL